MATLVIFFTNPGTYVFTAGATTTLADLVGAGGGGGEGSAVTSGGDGGRGGYRSQSSSTVIGNTYNVVVPPGSDPGANGASATFNGLTATGGEAGGDAGALSNGADGDNGTPDAANPYGFGAGGAGGGILNIGQEGGQQGVAVLSYSTGTAGITHSATMSRLLTLFRAPTAAIEHFAIMSRLVTIRRSFAAAITHFAEEFNKVRLPRSASITHQANKIDKAVGLPRTASITHAADHTKAITLFRKLAGITHVATFARRVTVRRLFNAAIFHTKRCYMKLEARLIPVGSGGVTIIKKIFAVMD